MDAASGRAGVIVKDAVRPKLPVNFVLHSLRHTFGTRLAESRGGRLHDYAVDGPQFDHSVTAVCPSVAWVASRRCAVSRFFSIIGRVAQLAEQLTLNQ